VGLVKLRIHLNRDLVLTDCFRRAALGSKHVGKIAMGLRHTGRQANGFLKLGERPVGLPQDEEH
jgi:hypothetical protein